MCGSGTLQYLSDFFLFAHKLHPSISKERNPQTKFDLAVILNDVTLLLLSLVRYDKKVCLNGKEIRWAYVLHFKHAFNAIAFQ